MIKIDRWRVIPANAGIQALNGIACCACDTQPLSAGGSAPAPWVPLFARAKKGTKESTPPGLRRSPRAALASGGVPTQPPCRGGARSRSLARPFGHVLRLPATLGLTKGERKTSPCHGLRWFAQVPVAAAEHRSRPRRARSAGGSRRLRGALSFGRFSLGKQRKVTCRRSATHK